MTRESKTTFCVNYHYRWGFLITLLISVYILLVYFTDRVSLGRELFPIDNYIRSILLRTKEVKLIGGNRPKLYVSQEVWSRMKLGFQNRNHLRGHKTRGRAPWPSSSDTGRNGVGALRKTRRTYVCHPGGRPHSQDPKLPLILFPLEKVPFGTGLRLHQVLSVEQ